MSDQPEFLPGANQTHQDTHGNSNQTIGQVYGGIVVYGNFTVTTSDIPSTAASKAPKSLGPNPYKGLLAFHESDSERFYGRSREVEILWERFRGLYESDKAIRLLPIYGPSGSGKSSLARAGLLPELGRKPLPGKDRARVVVMKPDKHPLQELAIVLARIAENDPTPVKKSREFADELKIPDKQGKFDGLQRIASAFLDISIFPLIILVDQLEEVYSLCENVDERDQFVANLLYAASDRSQYVSVITTFRSDFLGETHRHLALNQLFSQQGFLVPMMDEQSLHGAITQPAQNAGYTIDTATVNLLIQDTEGREGSLPLLQVALTRIWESLPEKEPAQTLHDIGGVGGALVEEAERIYCDLSEEDQAIAQRIFLGLVQLGEGTRDTRRRVNVNTLISIQDTPVVVQNVIHKFAGDKVRLITLSSDGEAETAEVTHEALLDRWPRLQKWLDDNRDDIRFQRRLEGTVQYWNKHGRPEGMLWRSPDLDLLQNFVEKLENNKSSYLQLTQLQLEFYQFSRRQQEAEALAEKRRIEAENRRIEAENARIRAENNRIAAEQKLTRRLRTFLFVVSGLMGIIALGSWIFSGKVAYQQKIIEAIFLGASTQEVIDSLPELEKSANDLRESIDTLPANIEPDVAISHYAKHENDFRKLFAYYRNILVVAGKLKLENSQYDIQQVDRIEQQLADILIKYRIPQLQLDFANRRVSEYLDKPVTEFENQYTEGHIRTTYEILMTSSGVGADLNRDGFIGDSLESNLFPCKLLGKLEEIWRDETGNTCGWYTPEGQYAFDSDCKELDEGRSTLYTAIFEYDMGLCMERIKACGILPR